MARGPTDGAGVELQRAVEATLAEGGWQTDTERVAAGTYRIAGLDPETSTRRFVLVVPSETATVTESQIEWLAGRAQEVDADVVEVTTNGSIAADARQLAREHDIVVRDPGEFRQPGGRTQQPPAEHTQQPPANQPPTQQPPAGQSQPQQSEQPPSQRPPTQQPPAQQPSTQETAVGDGYGQQSPPRQQDTQQPQQTNPQQPPVQQPAAAPHSGSSTGESVTRLATVGGGALGGVALVQPWVVSIEGSTKWNALATEMAPFAVAGVAVALVLPILGWGDGWGRLSALLSGAAGFGMVVLSQFLQDTLASQSALSYIEVEGNRAPLTLVEAGGGLDLFMIAGGLVVVTSLAGLIASFTE